MRLIDRHMNDIVHAFVVIFICLSATLYASITHDKSGNVWIVYGSGVAYAAGRSGAGVAARMQHRRTDLPDA